VHPERSALVLVDIAQIHPEGDPGPLTDGAHTRTSEASGRAVGSAAELATAPCPCFAGKVSGPTGLHHQWFCRSMTRGCLAGERVFVDGRARGRGCRYRPPNVDY
jgi:hypothetical protein